MAIAPHHYKSATPPPEPDEAYWTALLTQSDEADETLWVTEEQDWTSPSFFLAPHVEEIPHGHPEDWQAAETLFEHDDSVLLPVIGCNKGGLLVEWNSLRGFIPFSQLSEPQSLESYSGRYLRLRVIELNPLQNRLILSERAAQVSSGTRAQIFQTLIPHHLAEGIITNICDFGVFVDLGGVEGLIHISELSWGRVEHPAELVQRGQKVQVYIMDVIPDRGRIALSLKRLTPDPWYEVDQRYRVGQEVEGLITSVVDFGAFAALEKGLEGLIHISELAEGHFLHPRNVVSEGQKVRVRILNINVQHRRIGLSLRFQDEESAKLGWH